MRVGEVVAPRAAALSDRVRFFEAPPAPNAAGDQVTYRSASGPLTVGNPDFNIGDLNANAVLRWEYRPGSTLFVV